MSIFKAFLLKLGCLSYIILLYVGSYPSVMFLKNYERYPFETWNTCSLSKEEPITRRQMTL
jgi:hypothetical protein